MIRTKEEAEAQLPTTLLNSFYEIVDSAWGEYERDYRETRGNHRQGTQATVLHDLMGKHAQARLDGIQNVAVISQTQTVLVNVNDDWLIKFRKLRKGTLTTAANRTLFSDEFLGQHPLQLPLLREPTHLVVGYVLNRTKSGMQSVHVVCPMGRKRRMWDFEILPPAAAAQRPIPIAVPPTGPRVAPKIINPDVSKEAENNRSHDAGTG